MIVRTHTCTDTHVYTRARVCARENKGKGKDYVLLLFPAALFQLSAGRRGLWTTNTEHCSSQSFSIVSKNTLLQLGITFYF